MAEKIRDKDTLPPIKPLWVTPQFLNSISQYRIYQVAGTLMIRKLLLQPIEEIADAGIGKGFFQGFVILVLNFSDKAADALRFIHLQI